MAKGLGKTELLGVILLVALIVAITGGAVLLKNCSGPEERPALPVKVDVIDSSVQSSAEESSAGHSGKSTKKSGGRKRAASKSSSSSGSFRTSVERPDPFLDTIPLDWDNLEDWEEPATPFY